MDSRNVQEDTMSTTITLTETGRVDGPISDPAGDSGHVGFARVDVRIVTHEVTP